MIEITGQLRTYGHAEISMTNTQFAFIGGSSGSTSATARAEAFAVNGDSGNDRLINNNFVFANAESKNTGSGSAGTTFGSTNAASRLVARSNALALYGGDGEDTLINNGVITANVITTTKAENTVTSAFLFSDGKAESRGTNNAYGTLFNDTQKDTTVINTGTATLNHFGSMDSDLRGVARAFAKSTGVTGSINVNADAEARAYSNVNLRGVRLGDGSHMVENSGEIRVEAQSFSSGASQADGNSSISGDGNARGRAYVNSSRVTGVESLSGAVDFNNSGELFVLNSPDAASSARGRGTGLDIFRDPDGIATATIEMNNVHAYGVRSGAFDDVIDNSGSIYVESEPQADRALATGAALGSFSLSVDAFAYATATVNDAEAYGIHAGEGDNTIINSGSIRVVSDPYAEAHASSTGRGPDGDVTAVSTANALRAQAYGIVTGAGNDTITNTGSITVSATPSRRATRSATVGSFTQCIGVVINGTCIGGTVTLKGEVEGDTSPNGSTSKTIVAISTGDGNDTLVHAGSINAAGGTAINLGAGNDTLRLVAGNTISGSVTAGSGTDTLELEGALTFNATNLSFERFSKFAPGTANLTNISVVTEPIFPGSSIRVPVVANRFRSDVLVEQGVLNVNGATKFYGATDLTTHIYGDGRLGQFASTLTMTLDGDLIVVANKEQPYVDGRIYDVVKGSSRIGEFDRVTLPTSTALRSFTGEHISTGYRVNADIEAIVSVLDGATIAQTDFAQALDDVTATASGDVADTIAGLQDLSTAEGVQSSIEALTPVLSTTSLNIGGESATTSLEATEARLASFRSGFTGRKAQPTLGFTLQEAKRVDAGATAWAAIYDSGEVLPTFSNGLSGNVQGWTRGVDYVTRGGALVGFAMTQLDSGGSIDGFSDAAAFTSSTVSMYAAAPLSENSYATAMLSWGEAEILNDPVGYALVGQSGALFDNTTTALEARFEAGHAFAETALAPEVFGAFTYKQAKGAANTLSSAAGPALNVQSGQIMQLESEFGVRMIKNIDFVGVSATPHIALSWVSRYGDGESVTARFDDMPDHEFQLRSGNENRNAFRTKAGFNLLAGRGFELSASGIGEFGETENDVTGELRAVIKF